MRFNAKSLAVLLCLTALCVLTAAGCARNDAQVAQTDDLSDTYVFIGKNIQNPYMQSVYEGFENACGEIGAKALYKAPDAITPQKQIEIINSLIENNAAGIAIAANDENSLTEALQEAMNRGVKVISLDSAVNKDARLTHIQQVNPEEVGKELINAAYNLTGGSGGIAILSSTAQATNQNLWIDYMIRELEENHDKYASMPLVTTSYGDDDLTKSISETEILLKNPDVKVIIAPTAVGIQGAAQAISDSGSDVKLTGIGMSSQMSEYIDSGVCPVMFTWDPVEIGYLAGYTLDALAKGSVTGAAGESFSAGNLGSKTVSSAADGGTEVIVGSLMSIKNPEFYDYN